MDRLELEFAHRFVERWDAGPFEPGGKSRPLTGGPVPDLVELPEHATAVRIESDLQPALPDLPARPE